MATPKSNINNNRRPSSLLLVPIVAVLIGCIEMFLPRSVPTPSIFYPCTTSSNPHDTQSQATSPPTIVLIPGLDGATSFFDGVIPLLTPHADVLMFHLPLRPATMLESGYTFDYLSDELEKDIRAHLDVRNRRNNEKSSSDGTSSIVNGQSSSSSSSSVHLVGESFGGVIAQWLVTQPFMLANTLYQHLPYDYTLQYFFTNKLNLIISLHALYLHYILDHPGMSASRLPNGQHRCLSTVSCYFRRWQKPICLLTSRGKQTTYFPY